MTCPAGSPARVSPGRSSHLRRRAVTARCASGAPRPRPGGSSSCTSTTTSCGPPGPDWAASTELREDYAKHRPNVERAVAQVATWRGRRLKLRYRGTAKNHAWLKRRTAALNLRNLIGRGLDREDGTWVLAT